MAEAKLFELSIAEAGRKLRDGSIAFERPHRGCVSRASTRSTPLSTASLL